MLLDHWLWLYCVFSECCYIIQAKTIHFWLWLYCVFHWYYLCQSGQNCIHFGCDRIVYFVSTVYIIQAKIRPKQYLFWLDCIVYFVSTIYIIQAKTVSIFVCECIVYFVGTIYIIQAQTMLFWPWCLPFYLKPFVISAIRLLAAIVQCI